MWSNGHFANKCRSPFPKHKKFDYAQYVQEENEEIVTAFDNEDAAFSETYSDELDDLTNVWLLDLGTTRHITYRKECFWSYKPARLNPICLVDMSSHNKPKG
jgi:hypothetical protein